MPFVPTDIPGLKHWLESDYGVYQDAALATPCTDGTAVYTWQNRGSTAANFIQATAGNRPVWSASGGSNNAPHIVFSSDWLQATTASLASPITVFIVGECTSVTNGAGIAFGDMGTSWQIAFQNSSTGYLYAGGATPAFSFPPGRAFLMSTVRRTASPYDYLWSGRATTPQINGVSSGPTPLPANPLVGAGSNGTYSFQGKYYTLLVYDTALSDVNRALVVDYLATKYGLDLGTASSSGLVERPCGGWKTVSADEESAGELFSIPCRKDTTEGEAAAPCLALDFPGKWRFRWGVKSGVRTVSVNAKQVSNISGQRPRLIVKAEPLLGVASDVIVDAANSAGWVTLGPATITPTDNGVVWVELWNMDNTSVAISPAYFDDITVT